MPKINLESKQQIKNLSKLELEEIILKIASKDQKIFDFILLNYLDKESGEKDLFDKTKDDLEKLFLKRFKGSADEQKCANKIAACNKRITQFTSISNNKKMEVDLLLLVLDKTFNMSMLGSHFETYDYKCGMIIKKVINILKTKLHADYLIEYQERVNKYLEILNYHSTHISLISLLPDQI